MGKDGDKDEYGEPSKFDPNFKGPLDNRSCTDIICCILFTVCFVGMILIGIVAFAKGDPRLLLYPTDSEGNLCGYGDYEDKPNLFFFDLLDCGKLGPAVVINGCPTPQVCVKDCPDEYYEWYTEYLKDQTPGLSADRSKMICKYDVNPETSAKVCAKECPDSTFFWAEVILDGDKRSQMICKAGIDPKNTTKSIEDLVKDEDCAAYYVQSEPVLGRCFPSIFEDGFDILENLYNTAGDVILDRYGNNITKGDLEDGSVAVTALLNAKDYGLKIYQDVRATWWMIIIGLVVAMLLSFIWILLMRWLAFPMVWLTIILFIAIFGFATYYCFDKYIEMKDNPDHDFDGNIAITTDLDYYTNLSDTWLALGIIAAVFLLIIILVVLFLRSRILIAIALIKEASKAVGNMIFTLFWPIIPFVLQVILFGYWGASAVFLASMGTGQYRVANSTNVTTVETNSSDPLAEAQSFLNDIEVPCDPDADDAVGEACAFLKYGDDKYTMYLQIFMLFMLFWVMNFIVALSQMVLAGAFASYYWAFRKPKDIPAFPVTGSFSRTMRYHLGTLAFGSLIIAIIQMIRVALEYLDQKLKGSENQVARFAIKCLKCCFWCLEKIIKFINKNAYIMTAIYGYNFCTAAKNAFMLIMRNIVRVAVVDKVTDFLVFVGKLMVVGAVGLLAFCFFGGDLADKIPFQSISDYVNDYTPKLNFYLVPVIIIAIGSYVIASGFFSVYSMGVDSLFLCFLEDIERHDGSAQKPYYMSRSLMKLLGKKNTAAVEEARRGK